MNKKGSIIMVKFLVTVVLTLVLFIGTCAGLSKFGGEMLRVSDQARENFHEFVDVIVEVDKSPLNDQRTKVLIMDEGTVIAYFYNQADKAIMLRYGPTPFSSLPGELDEVFVERPFLPECNIEGNGCICLLRNPITEEDYEGSGFSPKKLKLYTKIQPGYMTECVSIDFHIELDNCNIGKPNDKETSYDCRKGFIIERNFLDKNYESKTFTLTTNRRNSFNIKKTSLGIEMTPSG